VFILVISSICFGGGEILFEEDWESGEIDEDIWIPAPGWQIVDGALDATGGESGFTVQNDFTDFEFSIDAMIVAEYIGFVMRAQDQENMFMHQVGAGDVNIWFHLKVGGAWTPEQVPIESGLALETDVWYRVKFIVEDNQTTYLMAELGEELNETDHLMGRWENDTYDSGAIGFRHWGNEHGQYDNILVTTIGYTQPVSPEGNLSTTWGEVKKSQ
jgi:hypothetical protein